MNKTESNDLLAYSFIQKHLANFGVVPSLRQIGRAVGYSSPRSAQLLLSRLIKKRLLRYSKGIVTLRSLPGVPPAERTVEVPLIGTVPCGLPSLAEHKPEAVFEVSVKFAVPGHLYFLLRARGNSMNKSGITDGDLVLVRKQPTAEQGERVVVLINDEATIKHFRRKADIVALHPNSTDKSHQPIFLSGDAIIQGVVITALPRDLWSSAVPNETYSTMKGASRGRKH
jgi:repressor LexA